MASNKIKFIILVFMVISFFVFFSCAVSAYTGYLPLDADTIASKYTSMVEGFSFRKSLLDVEGISTSNLISVNSLSTEEAELYTTLSVTYYEEDNVKKALKCSMHFAYNPNLPGSQNLIADFAYPFFEILFESKGYNKSTVSYMIDFTISSYEMALLDSSWKIYDSIGDAMIVISIDKSNTLPILKCEIYMDSYVPKASMNLNSLAVIYNSFSVRKILASAQANDGTSLSFKTTRNGFFLYVESSDVTEIEIVNAAGDVIYQRKISGKNAVFLNVPSGIYYIEAKGREFSLNVGQ